MVLLTCNAYLHLHPRAATERLRHADLLFTFHQVGQCSSKRKARSSTGDEMSCFVLEVETVVLIKTEDEGHFSQERVPPQDATESLKLFFCLTCCSFYDEVSTFAEILPVQPHLYRSYVIQTELNESAVNCVGRLNQRGPQTARPGSRWLDVQTIIFWMFLTYLPQKGSCDHTHATAGVSTNCRYSCFRGWDEQMFLRGRSLHKHLNPHQPLSFIAQKTPFHNQVIIEARCRH